MKDWQTNKSVGGEVKTFHIMQSGRFLPRVNILAVSAPRGGGRNKLSDKNRENREEIRKKGKKKPLKNRENSENFPIFTNF